MIYSFVLRGINALIKSRPMILRSVWRRKEGMQLPPPRDQGQVQRLRFGAVR